MNKGKINTFLEFKEYYKHNPDLFVKEFFDIELPLHQRIMLKSMDRLQAKKSVRSGRKLEYYFRTLLQLLLLEEDSKVAFYENKEYKELTREEAIEHILKKLNYK